MSQVALVLFIYFLYRNFPKNTTPIIEKVIERRDNIESSVHDGIKSAIQELEYEKEQKRIFFEKSKRSKNAMGIYSSCESSSPIEHSGGELIPFGLSENEKDILRQFYG